MIFSTQIFVGVPVSSGINEFLNSVDPLLKDLLIQSNDTYLREIEYQDQKYLGKFAGTVSSIQSVELLKDNVLSLLKKLFITLPLEEKDVFIVALPEGES